MNKDFRCVVLIVVFVNLGYFGIEFVVVFKIGFVLFFVDSVDFFEDVFVNLLIFVVLVWLVCNCVCVGMVMLLILLVFVVVFFWMVW